MLSKVINKRGYIIRKNILDEEKELEIKEELTMSPYVMGQAGKKFKLYLENANKLYIPKAYGIKKFGIPDKNDLDLTGDTIDILFEGSLRENQIPVIDAFMNASKIFGGGLVCLGCGYGKTIIGLKILTLLKKKTLIVVHKEFLLNQWIERMDEFLPTARVGIIQQNKIEIENKDIVIAMLQSLSMKEYEESVFSSFGFVILDECHHLGAEVFSKALFKINSKYMLGLTATPERKDGMRKVFEYFLGDIVYCVTEREPEKVFVKLIHYNCQKDIYKKEYLNFKGQINVPKMINQLCDDPERLYIIIEEIKIAIKEKRKILILSDRREHLTMCKELIDKLEICSTGYYVGGLKKEILKESESKDVILGTYSMASEGMDIPLLNTVILSTPKSDIEQSVGRILRQKKENRLVDPLIIDIIDQISNFKRQSLKRTKYYKKNNYIISSIYIPYKIEEPIKLNMDKCLF